MRSVVSDDLLSSRYSGGRCSRTVYYFRAIWRTLGVMLSCVRALDRYDAVVIQRVIFAPPFSWLLGRVRRKVAFDFDDAIYTTDGLDRGWLDRLQAWLRRKAVADTLRNVGHAIVENEQNRSFAAEYCPGASVITGPIDTDRYTPRPSLSGGQADGVVLGWVGKPATEPYLDLIRNPLSEVGRRHPGARLVLVGAERFDVPGLRVERRPWSLESEVADLWEFDIGLMPLPDDTWTRGKGGYKLLQYMALGIPSVASPVGINAEIVDHGTDGYLATTAQEWVDCLSRLIRDAEQRHLMGRSARCKAESRYSLVTSGARLLSILARLSRGPA